MLVVNLYGGPGSGKSTLAAGIFALLKLEGVNAELVTEYAKELVWGKDFKTLSIQEYVFAEQYRRLQRLRGLVEVVVTDSPLLLSLVYSQPLDKPLHELVWDRYNEFANLDIFVKRVKPYNPHGRSSSEEKSKERDAEIKKMLEEYERKPMTVDGDLWGINEVADRVMKDIGQYYSNHMIYYKPFLDGL